MKPSWLTQIIFLLVWIAVLSQGHLVRAQEQATITLSATPAFAGNYTLGTWLPITVDITNTGMALSAVLVADLPGSQTRYTQLVDLPGGGQRQFVLYVAMEQMAHEVLLTIEQDQAVLARQKLTVRPRSDERMLAILARTDPHIALPQREDLQSSPFTSLHISPADLP
ncbi:MAG: hypothetical protein HGA65_08755, partial [Oscillochloris sp.]|nr:hypothetical protein [Oscillochloris sp.]